MKNYAGWLVAVMVLTCVTVQGQDVEREGRRGWKPREGDGPPPHLRQDCKRPGPHGGDPLGCMDGLVGRIIHHKEIQEKLGLTETQVEKLRKRFFASREKLIDLRAELAKAGMRQARLMTADPVDEEALMQAVEQAGRARTGIA